MGIQVLFIDTAFPQAMQVRPRPQGITATAAPAQRLPARSAPRRGSPDPAGPQPNFSPMRESPLAKVLTAFLLCGHDAARRMRPTRRGLRCRPAGRHRAERHADRNIGEIDAMNLTDGSLRNPAVIAVVVAMLFLLGAWSVVKLPVQLFPDIDEPQISIYTGWRAAAPTEVESEILEPQEEALRGVPGLKELNTYANAGGAFVNLRFGIGTDMQRTLVDVISRMNQLPPLPRDATPPRISLGDDGNGGNANETLSWFFVQLLPETPGPVERYQQYVEDVIRPRIEAVPGVATVNVNAGAPEELQIRFDPYRAAELGIEVPAVAALAGSANDTSGGFVDIGRRQYTLRFAGRYTPAQLGELILDWRNGSPVRLGDIATISVRRGDRQNLAMQNGNPAMALQVMRESNANVLETLNAVKDEVAALRAGPLKEMGLTIEQSFDPSVFIYQAINLVTGNLLLGVLLAVGVLWLFLRQVRATLLVAAAIPICLLGTFVVLKLTGRTINVISLAGLAFAVGMVLDAAIVVIENVLRLREQGEGPHDAAARGASEVAGALLASTATTVAIFLPVIFLQDVEGQLFADLALTIAIAVVISLLVALTVIPTAARRWLGPGINRRRTPARWPRAADRLVALSDGRRRRRLMIVGLIGVPVAVAVLLLPRLDYLPPVKRNAVDGFFQFPPGASIDYIDAEIVQPIAARMAPYMSGEREPALLNYYVLVWQGGGTIGVRTRDPQRLPEIERIVREQVVAGFPDTEAFVFQGNLFGGFGDGRNIEVRLQSSDVESLLRVARQAMGIVTGAMPGAQVQPFQGLELAEPELRLTPDDRRLNEAGWDRATAGRVVRAMGDGLWIGEYFDGEQRMDVILRADGWLTPEQLESIPLATPAGGVVPLGELMRVETTVGTGGLRRVDRRRTIALNVSPPRNMSLEEAVTILKQDVEPRLAPLMPPDGQIRYAGSADSLSKAVSSMAENLGLAVVVLFLVMAALFRSVRDSCYVLLTIPLATVGGVAAIRLLNLVTFQPLDLLTMIGFVILMGLVVNNAILLVDQTRASERKGAPRREAVRLALALRMRPIFSTTLTTIFGMLPLVLVPGPGSVLYRGLGTVIAGGMAVNALFTLVLLPCLLRLGEPALQPQHAAPAGVAKLKAPARS
jgi:multidrug efflux pump subunit AcrB